MIQATNVVTIAEASKVSENAKPTMTNEALVPNIRLKAHRKESR